MPIVPINQTRVQTKTANVEALKLGTASKEAMGNDIASAQDKLFQSVASKTDAVANYYVEEQNKESEKKALKAATDASDELQRNLYDQSLDEEGKPKGIMLRRLGQVGDATIDYDKVVEEINNKYSSSLSDREKEKFSISFGTQGRAFRDNIAKHEVSQKRADFDNVFETQKKNQINNASTAINDDALSELIGSTQLTVESALKTKGLDSESIALQKSEVVNQMIQANVLNKYEVDPDGAKITLESFKDSVTPEFYQKLDKVVEGKRFDTLRSTMWDSSFKNMKLSDGNINLARVEKSIKESKFTPDQQAKLYDFAQAKAGELRQQKTQLAAAENDSFYNDFAKTKARNVPLEEALKVAGKHGGDAWDVSQREDFIKKAYSTPVKTDPEVYLATWEKVQDGVITKEELRDTWKNNNISNDDFEALSKDLFKRQSTGEGDKGMDRIKLLAAEKFNQYDKLEKDQYLYEMAQATRGMKPEQKLAYAQDALQKVVTSTGTLWDTKKPKYQVDLMKRDANSEAWGAIYNDIGAKEVEAIIKGQARKGATSFGIDDVDKIASALGGYESMKVGTPANNAMKSLIKNNKPVNVENIRALLQQRPDGQWN